MKSKGLLLIICILAQGWPILSHAGSDNELIRAKDPKNRIEGLEWKLEEIGGTPPRAKLHGAFKGGEWSFLINREKVKGNAKGFTVEVGLTGTVTQLEVSAIGPTGENFVEEMSIVYPDWNNYALGERPDEWWIVGRMAQAVVAYTTHDVDLGVDATGAAVVGLYSAELRWRAGRKQGQLWTLSGSANFEMIRQIVLTNEFDLPRYYARLFYNREESDVRTGPFLQLQGGQSGVFEVKQEQQARKAVINREGFGLGGVIVYRPAPTMALTGLALLRLDMGGKSSDLPSPLSPSIGSELDFGVGLALSRTMILEGRLRYLQESYSWKPALAGSTDTSDNTNRFVIFDVGVGFKL